jgi:hypothetical protein
MKKKSLQQEIDEYQFQETKIYQKYIVDFYKLHKDKDNETIKQLYKEHLHLHLIISNESLQDIISSSKFIIK